MKEVIPRLVSVLSRLSGRLGARLAWYLWFHPHGRRNTRYPEAAEEFTLEVFGHQMDGFTLGEGEPVLLLHGWGGASTDMAPLAGAVADAGYRAVVPDLPGHGSDKSSYTDVFRMAATVDAAAGRFGPPRAVVAHSFGAVVTFAAFQHGGPERVVLVAPAVKGEWFLDAFGEHVGLSDKAYRIFRERFEAFAGPQLMSVLSGNGDVPGADILVLHDPEDDRTPYADAVEYTERRAATKLIAVPGTGHKGILRDADTRAETVSFIRGGYGLGAGTGTPGI
ncbi:MAG: alpha/beta hydrolase [Acidimicrobiia bacterium]|nr:alpha/beta hydrolase [Acidimicrobiia bacterium]